MLQDFFPMDRIPWEQSGDYSQGSMPFSQTIYENHCLKKKGEGDKKMKGGQGKLGQII